MVVKSARGDSGERVSTGCYNTRRLRAVRRVMAATAPIGHLFDDVDPFIEELKKTPRKKAEFVIFAFATVALARKEFSNMKRCSSRLATCRGHPADSQPTGVYYGHNIAALAVMDGVIREADYNCLAGANTDTHLEHAEERLVYRVVRNHPGSVVRAIRLDFTSTISSTFVDYFVASGQKPRIVGNTSIFYLRAVLQLCRQVAHEQCLCLFLLVERSATVRGHDQNDYSLS